MRVRLGARVSLNLSASAGLRSRLKSLTPARPKLIAAGRRVVSKEYEQGAGFTASGGTVPWPKTQPFGEEEGGKIAFQRSRLRKAWTTEAAGSYSKVTDFTIEVGVLPRSFPWLEVHRGKAAVAAFTIIKAKRRARSRSGRELQGAQRWAMFWAVKGATGATLSEDKMRVTGIKVPARPHGHASKQYRAAITQAVAKWVLRGETA